MKSVGRHLRLIEVVFSFMLFCSGCSSVARPSVIDSKQGIKKDIAVSEDNCFDAVGDSLDYISGCAGYIIHVPKLEGKKMQFVMHINSRYYSYDSCYSVDLGDLKGDKGNVMVYVEFYKSWYFKTYCSDVIVSNYEEPLLFPASSGNLIFQIKKHDNGVLIMNASLDNLLFVNRDTLSVKDSLRFSNVVVSSWGG